MIKALWSVGVVWCVFVVAKYHVKKVYNSTCFGYMMLFYFGTFLPCVVNLLSLN